MGKLIQTDTVQKREIITYAFISFRINTRHARARDLIVKSERDYPTYLSRG